jgi:hypothetical protein
MRTVWWRRWETKLLLLTGIALAGAAGMASARQQPRHPTQLTGEDWQRLDPHEQQSYLRGFLAGAAAEQVRALAAARGAADDSSAISSAAVDSLRSAAALHFRFAPAVYAAQLNDFYWWTDHRDIPIVDAMIAINTTMLQHAVQR